MAHREKEELYELGDRLFASLGCYVVDVEIERGRSRPLLRFFIGDNDGLVTVDQCARASKALSRHLDESGLFGEDYALEVSSPGLERRVARARDFIRFVGRQVRIRTRQPVEGRKKFEGAIEKADETMVTLAQEEAPLTLTYEDIARANLVYEFTSGKE